VPAAGGAAGCALGCRQQPGLAVARRAPAPAAALPAPLPLRSKLSQSACSVEARGTVQPVAVPRPRRPPPRPAGSAGALAFFQAQGGLWRCLWLHRWRPITVVDAHARGTAPAGLPGWVGMSGSIPTGPSGQSLVVCGPMHQYEQTLRRKAAGGGVGGWVAKEGGAAGRRKTPTSSHSESSGWCSPQARWQATLHLPVLSGVTTTRAHSDRSPPPGVVLWPLGSWQRNWLAGSRPAGPTASLTARQRYKKVVMATPWFPGSYSIHYRS